MPILYLLTAPKPVIEGTDATFQEVEMLRAAFGGDVVHLSPRKQPHLPYPLPLLGLHKVPTIRRLERWSEISHVYHSVLYPFPVLRLLKNPIVYTVLTSLGGLPKPTRLEPLARLHRIVVSSERDAEILESWGLTNGAVVGPAIDTGHLTHSPLPMQSEVTLLMASAPWVEDQFEEKGVDALLEAAARMPELRLILLWRGLLESELRSRIAALGLEDRVEVVPSWADIDQYLKRAHAAVLLAKRGDIVRAFPHSLLESLVAGKPVILSEVLPMAAYVRQHDCGVVVDAVDVQALCAAVDILRSRYEELARNACAVDAGAFSPEKLVSSYREIYASAARPS